MISAVVSHGSDILMAMPRVDFSRLSPAQYEDMVSVLLSRIRQAHRVDGSGGDGGLDCYFSDENGTDVYELKSFTGRMNAVRRQQVTRSLQRALEKAPRTWSLVVPIDATPREQEWFGSLASGTATRLTWLGRTWLEEQLAAHPDIGRYFAGAAEEVIQLLKDIAREDALPSDPAGVGLRVIALVARLNEIDPYYAFDFAVAEARTVISCRPRYPDALRDRPISFSAQLKLDDATPPGLRAAIDDFMVYGSAVQIPAENISALSIDMPRGLGEFAGGGIALDGKIAVAGAAEARHLVLRVPPAPPVRHVLLMDILSRSKGPAGGFRLQAQDRAGLLTLDMRLNPATSTYDAQLSYQFNDQVLPKDAVPVLALCNALAAGEQMAIATLDGQILALGSGPFSHLNWPDGDGYLRCARQLAAIQERAGVFFPLPIAFESEDQYWMDYADKLLRGEDVQITWPGSAGQCNRDQVRFFLEETAKIGEAFTFFNRSQEILEFAGGKLPLGWVTEIAHSTKIANLGELKTWYDGGGDGQIEMRLAPANNNQMTVRLADAHEVKDTQPGTPTTP
jgi:hypothetical protein